MSQIDRLVVSRGPALVTFGGGFFLSREDITVELSHQTGEIGSDAFGKLTDVQLGLRATCNFRPVGEFEHLGVLWPYASTVPGTSIFGNADSPLVIKPLDKTQQMVTFHAGAVSQMPNLTFTARDTIIGDVGFQMVGKNNTATDDPNRLFTFAENNIAAVPYDPDKLLVQPYTSRWFSATKVTLTFGGDTTEPFAFNADAAAVQAAFLALDSVAALNGDPVVTGSLEEGWAITFDAADGNVGAVTAELSNAPAGSLITPVVVTPGVTGETAAVQQITLTSPWLDFASREGVTVNFNLTTTEDESDAIGHYDTIFSGLDVTATALPQGIPLATVLEAARVQGPSSVRGRKLNTGAQNLVISGDGVHFVLYGAQLDGAGIVRSSRNQAVPPLTWRGSRSVGAGGAINPLFYIGENAPA